MPTMGLSMTMVFEAAGSRGWRGPFRQPGSRRGVEPRDRLAVRRAQRVVLRSC